MIRTFYKSFMFVALSFVLLLKATPCNAGEAQDKFEQLAEKLMVFDASAFLYDRPSSALRGYPVGDRYEKYVAEISAIEAEVEELTELLKHSDPKVRTLALAALLAKEDPKLLPYIHSMVDDSAETFPSPRSLPAPRILTLNNTSALPPTNKQTVGQIARNWLNLYMIHAGFHNGPEDTAGKPGFKTYWAERKDRDYCASWFDVKLRRRGQSTSSTRKGRIEKIRNLRKQIDAIDGDDSAWILLLLFSENYGDYGSQHLVSEKELIEICKKLGPEKLMLMLQRKIPTDDPDLQPRKWNDEPYKNMSRFVLQHAGKLLRKKDAPILLKCEKFNRSHWWPIAAAHLLPENPSYFLHEAFKRFSEDYQADYRAEMVYTIFKLVKKTETGFILDWFYTEEPQRGQYSHCLAIFMRKAALIPGAKTRNLFAAIINDKRFGKLDWQSLDKLTKIINSWVDRPIIDPEEWENVRCPVYKGDFHWRREEAEKKSPEKTGEYLKEIDEYRQKLRDSIPLWNE
ncbi:MAG: hypothetical protein E3J72_16120 [Planctomycetota bacterium]|nr:MAG: hypothetical protein E3J72_16120 [Planctomycetota bacterium]